MARDREQAGVASLLLALIAAAVLGTGLLLVANRSVDQAAVTAEPGTGPGSDGPQPAVGGDADPAGDAATDGPTGGPASGTATTRPEPSSGQAAPSAPTAPAPAPDAAGAPTGPGTAAPGTAPGAPADSSGDAGPPSATSDPATSGTAGTTPPADLPYGTAAAERTAAAQAPAELARTGPAVPSAVAVLLVAAGLVLAGLAWAGAPADD